MRLDEVEMLIASGRATAHQVKMALDLTLHELETSGATRLLSSIDVCNTQLSSAIVGIFSLYESRLQSTFGWKQPFDEAQKLLTTHASAAQAEEFENYRLVVNVLKHGEGSSHRKLLARRATLPFKVQATFGELHEEGDCTPPTDLVVVDTALLSNFCDAIEKSWALIQAHAVQLAGKHVA